MRIRLTVCISKICLRSFITIMGTEEMKLFQVKIVNRLDMKKILLFTGLLCSLFSLPVESKPLPCSVSTQESCPAVLYYVSNNEQTVPQIADTFNVKQSSVEPYGRAENTYLIDVACSCDHNSNSYFAKTPYLVKKGNLWEQILTSFNGLALEETKTEISSSGVVEVKLQCGCLDSFKVMSYQIVQGDFLSTIADRFNANLSQIVALNGIANPDVIMAGNILYLPLPPLEYPISKVETGSTSAKRSGRKFRTSFIIGVFGGVIMLMAAMMLGMFYLQSKTMTYGEQMSNNKGIGSSQDLESIKQWKKPRHSFWPLPCASSQTTESVNKYEHAFSMTKGPDSNSLGVTGFDSEKPIAFAYDEILAATDNFEESKKLGHGSNGSVYLGNLRDKEVAIKQMVNTNSKQFLAELKVLCKVHHINLVELIGYSIGDDHLFLIYEFAEQGALSDCLHDPIGKGYQPLSWTARVQIALDSAKGLEYIHENTKPQYVHCDVKTSNILLDRRSRAKIADFGLVKLLESSAEGGITTRVVGTFGYLAPEYVQDGHVTAKSDVYAFGVVLMELITGQEAVCISAAGCQSLISFMLPILKDQDQTSKLKGYVDPNLTGYHEDSLMRMAQLAKACTDKDPNLRPDMRNVVFILSQLLLSSIEWEAGEASGSQIFSGICQGR